MVESSPAQAVTSTPLRAQPDPVDLTDILRTDLSKYNSDLRRRNPSRGERPSADAASAANAASTPTKQGFVVKRVRTATDLGALDRDLQVGEQNSGLIYSIILTLHG